MYIWETRRENLFKASEQNQENHLPVHLSILHINFLQPTRFHMSLSSIDGMSWNCPFCPFANASTSNTRVRVTQLSAWVMMVDGDPPIPTTPLFPLSLSTFLPINILPSLFHFLTKPSKKKSISSDENKKKNILLWKMKKDCETISSEMQTRKKIKIK